MQVRVDAEMKDDSAVIKRSRPISRDDHNVPVRGDAGINLELRLQ